MGKTLYVGYDLGDGETLITFAEYVNNGEKNYVDTQTVRMPEEEDKGTAIPTAYGISDSNGIVLGKSLSDITDLTRVFSNFKKQPTTLLENVDGDISVFSDCNSEWPNDLVVPELNTMKEHVVTFTNALFSDQMMVKQINIAMQDKDDIVFIVGCPTKWTSKMNSSSIVRGNDQAIYRKILQQSIIGKDTFKLADGREVPSTLEIKKESQAAFLNAKEKYFTKVGNDKNYYDKSRVLIDVGSSTVDITACGTEGFKKDGNIGNTYLGARIIDFLITDMYLNKLKQTEEWSELNSLINNNKDIFNQIVLACRNAKEVKYSRQKKEYVMISVHGGFDIKFSNADLREVEDKPIKPILEKYLNYPQEILDKVGNKSWKEEFKSFLEEQRDFLINKIQIRQIILTGSASKMPFVRTICEEVFPEISSANILEDLNPASCISEGLAQQGGIKEKSNKFEEKCRKIITEKLPMVFDSYYVDFANKLGNILYELIISEILQPCFLEWKEMSKVSINTLKDMVFSKTKKDNIEFILEKNTKYQNEIQVFSNKVSKWLEMNLKEIFSGNTDYEERSTEIVITTPNGIQIPVNIDYSEIFGLISGSIVYIVSFIVVILTGYFFAQTFGLGIPIIAVGAKLCGKSIEEISNNIKNSVTNYIESKKMSSLEKNFILLKVNSQLKKEKDKSTQDVIDNLLKQNYKEKIINSIRNNIDPIVNTAIVRIQDLLEDN